MRDFTSRKRDRQSGDPEGGPLSVFRCAAEESGSPAPRNAGICSSPWPGCHRVSVRGRKKRIDSSIINSNNVKYQ